MLNQVYRLPKSSVNLTSPFYEAFGAGKLISMHEDWELSALRNFPHANPTVPASIIKAGSGLEHKLQARSKGGYDNINQSAHVVHLLDYFLPSTCAKSMRIYTPYLHHTTEMNQLIASVVAAPILRKHKVQYLNHFNLKKLV